MRGLAVISLGLALAGCAEIGLDARGAAHSRLVEHFAEQGRRGDLVAQADCYVDRMDVTQQGAVAVAQHPAELAAILDGVSDKAGLGTCLRRAGGGS